MDRFAAVLAAEAMDPGPVSPSLEVAVSKLGDSARPDYISVAVTAISDTLLAVFNLASAQGAEKRTAAYHPRRSLAGKACRAGGSTVLEWTSQGELLQKTRGRPLDDIRSAQRYGVRHVVCVVIPQPPGMQQLGPHEASEKRPLGVLTLGYREELCPDDRFKGDLLALAAQLSQLMPAHIPAFLRDLVEFSPLLPSYTGQCVCCGGPRVVDDVTGLMTCPCAASSTQQPPDQDPDSGAAPPLLSGTVTCAEPDPVSKNRAVHSAQPAAAEFSESAGEQSEEARGTLEQGAAVHGGPLLSPKKLAAGEGTGGEEESVERGDDGAWLGGTVGVSDEDPKLLLQKAAAAQRYMVDPKLQRFVCQQTEDDFNLETAAHYIKWDYSLLAVHMTAIYITVLLPPFSIWQHESAAAWLFTVTAAMFAVTWDKLTYLKHRDTLGSIFILLIRAYMVWSAAKTMELPNMQQIVAKHFLMSVPITYYLDGFFFASKKRYRVPLVVMDIYGATKASSAGYWFLPPGAATAVCLASSLAAELLSYYMWKRSDRAARTDFVSKRLGMTMQARGRVATRA